VVDGISEVDGLVMFVPGVVGVTGIPSSVGVLLVSVFLILRDAMTSVEDVGDVFVDEDVMVMADVIVVASEALIQYIQTVITYTFCLSRHGRTVPPLTKIWAGRGCEKQSASDKGANYHLNP